MYQQFQPGDAVKGRRRWRLKGKPLRLAIYDTILHIKDNIDTSTQQTYSYQEEIIIASDGLDDTIQLKDCQWAGTIFKASYRINDNLLEEPIFWAASYRKFNFCDNSIFQMEDELTGLLGELFLCALFNYDQKKFWDEYITISSRKDRGIEDGDEGWDIKAKPKGKRGEPYKIDAKTISQAANPHNYNIGNLNKDGTPKCRDVLIAPIYLKWDEDDKKLLHLTLTCLVDAQTFWDFTEFYYDTDLRLSKGYDEKGKLSRYVRTKEHPYFKDNNNSEIDFNPRFADLQKDWPLIALRPRTLSDDELHEPKIELPWGGKLCLANIRQMRAEESSQ